MNNPPAIAPFAQRLLAWFDVHGRRDLPWQHPRTAYRAWVAEVMLQQTQVKTVIPYFTRFMQRFPDVRSLASASLDEVLSHWAGLGYYARGRNLHRAAQQIVAHHGGELPRDLEAMHALPGIGLSTAGAILAQAHGARHAILDGNVKRVLARHAAVPEWPGSPAATARLWTISESLLPQSRLADYTQAVMDLGASLCTTRVPACIRCPVQGDCVAYLNGRVADFPAPRPKRARPVRQAVLLLIENSRGELLLERRPPTGIWGGLWSPPVIVIEEGDAEVLPEALRRYSLSTATAEKLPTIRHAFTHFELVISPHRLRAAFTDVLLDAGRERWVTLDGDLPALPTPISRLLRSLRNTLTEPTLFPCPEPSTA